MERKKKDKKEKREKKVNKEKKRRREGSDGSSSEDEEAALARANRKASKRAEKVAKLLGYSNDTNPFGDPNLLQPFVWGKKQDKDVREGRQFVGDTDVQRLKTMEEIERARKRREDREKEMEEMERLRTEEQRLRDSAQYGDWQTKEEEFHMEQTRERSKIRITESREQPIDTIAKNILVIESELRSRSSGGKKEEFDLTGLRCELRDPSKIVNGLSEPELEKLLTDIDSYVQLEKCKAGSYQAFWESLYVVADAELRAQRHKHYSDSTSQKAVSEDIKNLLGRKTAQELAQLQEEINTGLLDGSRVDPDYWRQALEAVVVQRARIVVTDTHQQLLQKQLEALSRLRERAEMQGAAEVDGGVRAVAGAGYLGDAGSRAAGAVDDKEDGYEREFGDSEEKMEGQDEVSLPAEGYSWEDKIRPRKPRYFNHVRTGWDWNKYNQTHYDHDNPPPRTVHGYKFNLFYPDLIDKSTTPKFFVEASESKDFAVLRFHAGPPYEDVAFRILNKEWEVSRRGGFKSVFSKGVLQLHFNFKRRFYRR